MITRYHEYINFLDKKLEKMFLAQKDYIKCQKGCSLCCKEGEYPISELEYIDMMMYYENLDDEIKQKIDTKIEALLKEKNHDLYECPFLIDDSCSIYPARSIICRTFGLIYFDESKKKKVPFCIDKGLNYSNVYDNNVKQITSSIGEEIPKAYNIGRVFLRSKKIEKEFNIMFGDDKRMVDWLKEDFFKE